MAQKVYGTTSFFNVLKDIVSRFYVLFLVVLAVLFILVGKADNVAIEKTQSAAQSVTLPLVNLLSLPARGLQSLSDTATGFFRLREENKRLLAERDVLKEWETVARTLMVENKALKDLMHYVPPPELKFVTARVVANTGTSFAQELVVLAGRDDGVSKGHIVLTGDSVIGRVVATASRISHVLLITDINSRLPVMIEGTGLRAILAGDNSPTPLLIALPLNQRPKVGDRVVTSHQSDLFPQGLPIGFVSEVSNRTIRVTPFSDPSSISIVRIVDFRLTSVLPENTEED